MLEQLNKTRLYAVRHRVSKVLHFIADKIAPADKRWPIFYQQVYLQGFTDGHRLAIEEDYSWMLESLRRGVATYSDDDSDALLGSD